MRPQRSSLILDGKPIAVHKIDARRVAFDLPRVNAVGERIFDGIPMLPRHLLERAWREGKLNEAWGLRTSPEEIAGLGPFRLKESVPGQRIVLERNPYYWKSDGAGTRLPYLDQLAFTFSAGEDMQVMRFNPASPMSSAALQPGTPPPCGATAHGVAMRYSMPARRSSMASFFLT